MGDGEGGGGDALTVFKTQVPVGIYPRIIVTNTSLSLIYCGSHTMVANISQPRITQIYIVQPTLQYIKHSFPSSMFHLQKQIYQKNRASKHNHYKYCEVFHSNNRSTHSRYIARGWLQDHGSGIQRHKLSSHLPHHA